MNNDDNVDDAAFGGKILHLVSFECNTTAFLLPTSHDDDDDDDTGFVINLHVSDAHQQLVYCNKWTLLFVTTAVVLDLHFVFELNCMLR